MIFYCCLPYPILMPVSLVQGSALLVSVNRFHLLLPVLVRVLQRIRNIRIYIFVSMYVYYVCVYTYLYLYVSLSIYLCLCLYLYAYTYICIEKETEIYFLRNWLTQRGGWQVWNLQGKPASWKPRQGFYVIIFRLNFFLLEKLVFFPKAFKWLGEGHPYYEGPSALLKV